MKMLSLLISTLFVSAFAGVQQTYYVSPAGSDNNSGTKESPFLSFAKAQYQVKSVNKNMTGDIVVYFRAGYYEVSKTIAFSSLDGGTNGYNVIYSAYPGEKASLTGGRVITGWSSMGNGIYKAPLGGPFARQLYVEGIRAVRARHPNISEPGLSFISEADTSGVAKVNIATDEIQGFESVLSSGKVMIVITKSFEQLHLHVSAVEGNGDRTWLTLPEVPWDRDRMYGNLFPGTNYYWVHPYYLQGPREFLDEEGEWSYDIAKNELYYKPRAGENMATAAAIFPRVTTLLNLQGTVDKPVCNIQFKGLRFEHCNWYDPEDQGIYYRGGAGFIDFGGFVSPAAIEVTYGQNIRLERNIFRHLGGQGLTFLKGVQNSSVVGNVFTDISGGGIFLNQNGKGFVPADERELCKNNTISNNYLNNVACENNSGWGMQMSQVPGIIISHNEFENLSDGAICLVTGQPDDTLKQRDVLIQYNRVHDVVKLFCDNGGIYVYGRSPNSRIFENYVYNIPRQPYGPAWNSGVYLDEQNTHEWTVENNVMENCPNLLGLNNPGEITLVNQQKYLGDISPLWTVIENGSLDEAAVKANSGIEPSYLDIKNLLFDEPNLQRPGIAFPIQIGKYAKAEEAVEVFDILGRKISQYTGSASTRNRGQIKFNPPAFATGIYFFREDRASQSVLKRAMTRN